MRDEEAPATEWGVDPSLNDVEALMWKAEASPRLRSAGVFVDLLDRAPDWERLVAAHEWAVELVPRLRQRVVEDPLRVGPPSWVLVDGLDDGRAAYLLKLHHSLTDGQASIQLFELLHSTSPDPTPDKAAPST